MIKLTYYSNKLCEWYHVAPAFQTVLDTCHNTQNSGDVNVCFWTSADEFPEVETLDDSNKCIHACTIVHLQEWYHIPYV
jgi:hypothetical protein